MDFLRQFYNNCIFCGNDLPEDYDGEGEHPIPKNLGSSWHIDVVCADCRQYFGDHIDQLGICNPYILEAMDTLGIGGTDANRQNIPHVADDVYTGAPVEMTYHKSDFRSRMTVNEADPLDGSSIPESLFENHLRHYAKTLLPQGLLQEEIEPEINRILNWEQAAKPGDICYSKIFDTHFRKMTARGIRIDSERLKSLSPLVAKIVVCGLHMFLSESPLNQISDLQGFINHARFGAELLPYQCGPILPRGDDWPQASRFHSITMEFFEKTVLFDTLLFGTILWRAILKSKKTICLEDPRGNVSKLKYVIDMAEQGNTRKILLIMHNDSTDWIGGELQGV